MTKNPTVGSQVYQLAIICSELLERIKLLELRVDSLQAQVAPSNTAADDEQVRILGERAAQQYAGALRMLKERGD